MKHQVKSTCSKTSQEKTLETYLNIGTKIGMMDLQSQKLSNNISLYSLIQFSLSLVSSSYEEDAVEDCFLLNR